MGPEGTFLVKNLEVLRWGVNARKEVEQIEVKRYKKSNEYVRDPALT